MSASGGVSLRPLDCLLQLVPTQTADRDVGNRTAWGEDERDGDRRNRVYLKERALEIFNERQSDVRSAEIARRHIGQLVRDRDHFKLLAVRLASAYEIFELGGANVAPGRPKVDDDDFAAK